MNENELRQMAADAICSRIEDIQIVDGIPEYRPGPIQIRVVVEDESKPLALRASAEIV